MSQVRVRFCPSPTGDPHVGMVRTALFNWAFARHEQGTFVFRIEDTDQSRDSEESYQALLSSLRWLGLDWDEGPEVGGPCGPYRQSERTHIYSDVVDRLLAAGHLYRCFCSPADVEARYERAKQAAKDAAAAAKAAAIEVGAPDANAVYKKVWAEQAPVPGYDRHCRQLSESESQQRAASEEFVLRFRMPDREWAWHDLIRGEVSFDAKHVPDYAVVRPNGRPLYTLVNPVDDALMEVTHVLRGEDLLSSTPRQLAMYEALRDIGLISHATPQFGHLPYVMGEGNKKLSKRDPESSLNRYREEGFLPEGLLNYLALLGWSPGGDREFFSMSEMAQWFEIGNVNANPARFDIKKCRAINGDWIRAVTTDELTDRLVPQLQAAGLIQDPASEEETSLVREVVPLIQERMDTLAEAIPMVSFLFVDEEGFVVDPDDANSVLKSGAADVLAAALTALESLDDWSTDGIGECLRVALIDDLGLKPRVAFGAVRLAITGRRISPPLFESMELLGRARSMSRLRGLAAELPTPD
ncbi:MAG: glutamate--tRNA ligase [Actinobacteria bacterium]|nr:glutamate--tRNA ligase [Actinomycetota bacterium]